MPKVQTRHTDVEAVPVGPLSKLSSLQERILPLMLDGFDNEA